MIDIHAENDWSTHFDVTDDDLNRAAARLESNAAPQELKEIALHIIQGRMERGDDPGIIQPAEGVLLKDGQRILSRLADALQFDPRFTGLEGKWFLAEKLPRIERDALQKIHRRLLQTPSLSDEEMLSVVNENGSTDRTLWRMALHAALRWSPERFENIGTPARPQWKSRLPDIEQAKVTHYAYDPETYEVLCRPGQQLTQKKADRLQELKLYAHVVTFAE